jgi:hypothetical protein
MTIDTITALPDPNGFSVDPLTDLIRTGARQLIVQAVEAELSALLAQFSNETTLEGHARIVRHGHLPEREVMAGVGPVAVKVPRIRDRGKQTEKVRFTSSIPPPYLRKTKSVEELLPWLYLKGISTGDFQEALAALLGPNAVGLSSTTISRLKADWWADYERWQKRDLSARRIVYIWADGVYFQPRMEEKQCVLVVIGADEWGRKEFLGLTDCRPDLPPRLPDPGRTRLSALRPDRRPASVPPDQQALRADICHRHHQPGLRRMAERLWRCKDDHRAPRPPYPSLRDRRDRQRKLALQEPGITPIRYPAGPPLLRYVRATQRRACSAQGGAILDADRGSKFNAD